MALEQAIHDLESAAEDTTTASANPGAWRTAVRERLQRVRAGLAEPLGSRDDGWLVARAQHAERDRCALLDRITATTMRMSEPRPSTTVLPEIRRLARDLARYGQRVRDLDYDAVELELGGFD